VSEKPFWLLILGGLLLMLVGCSDIPAQETSFPPASPAVLTPYYTQTPLQTAAPTATLAPTPTLPPLPTPTPYLYTIVQGDTMIGIAINFGITYDELSLANPEVNPNFLSVGTQLVIPLPEVENTGEGAAETVVPEVLPLQTGEVLCYPVRSGGMWCYWPVTNTTQVPAENIAGIIRLYDERGEEVATQSAYSFLNLLPAGNSMPLAAYFSPPVPSWKSVQGQLSSAVEANQSEIRYLKTEIQNLERVPITQERLGYQISGSLVLPTAGEEEGTSQELNYAWVLAVAYDLEGKLVGIRRWEAAPEQLGAEINFDFQIFSLGKQIEKVDVLAEARANQP
jgi:LysM repeat protein